MTWVIEDLDAFLRGSGINHFPAREVCPVGREAKGGVKLQLVPHVIWQNIVGTLLILEEERAHFGNRPITVHSGYRDPLYNKAVGGEENSLHMSFNAIDHSIEGVDPLDQVKWLDNHPKARFFGIGYYKKSGFVHLDTRGLLHRPAPARWDYETHTTWWK